MKINFVIWYMKCNGGNRIVFEVANRLAERGHDVTITSTGGDASWFPDPKFKFNIVPTRFRYPSIPNLLSSFTSLARHMPQSDVDVATWCFTTYPIALGGKGKRFYYAQHYEPLFFKSRLARYIAKKSYDLDFKIISNSSFVQKMILKNHAKRSELVFNAVDHRVFRPMQRDRRKTKRLVCQWKAIDWKGGKELLEALKTVSQKIEDFEVVFYGLKPPSENFPFKYSFVKFPADEELAKLYNSADVVVCPSWYESQPLPVMEAMCCGTPTVTTRLGTEDFAFNGKNSLVVEPRNPQALAEAIIKVLSDKTLWRKLSSNGIKTMKGFSWERSVDAVERIFQNAVKS